MKSRILIWLLIASQLYAQTGSIFVDENHNGHRIFNVATPSVGADVTNKTYVDSVAGGGAPTTAHYVTTQTESGLSNEFSLGALASGLLKQSVTTGVSTPAIATPLVDYWDTTEVSASGPGLIPQLPNDSTLFFNGIGEYVAIPASGGSSGSQLISGGGVAWTGTNFDYIISSAVYIINGVQYSSAQTDVTLDPADATFDRIDVFYVDTDGLAGVITGTPASNPVAPSVDPATQLYLSFAYVVAASTEPVVTTVDIYLENTEYTMSTNSAGTINLASTNNPYAGTKDIEGTSTATGNFFTAVKPSGTLDLSGYQSLIFQIRSKATWPNPKSLSIFWLNGTTVVGSSVALRNGVFGFDSSQTSSYQQIVIPISSFGTGATAIDRLRVAVAGGGGNIGWYIDNIILQSGSGGGGGGGSGDFSTNTTTSVVNELVQFADTTGKLGKRSTGTGIATLTSGVLGTTTDNHTNWDTAYTDRLKWDGGATGLTAATGRTSLGGTTVGQNIFTLTNPSAVTWVRMNADNTVTARTAAETLGDLGGSAVTPAALTKADDTNVTLT